MQQLDFEAIRAMKGNGSSMRMVLKYFIDQGGEIFLLFEKDDPIERYFLVRIDGIEIPLRAAKLNFYSVFNSLLAQTITTDKSKTHAMLSAWNLPTPATKTYEPGQEESFLNDYRQVVVKPRDGSHGEGITLDVKDVETLQAAVSQAKTIDDQVLLQQQVEGSDYRLLFVDYQLSAAVKRVPATVTGNGVHTIQELIEAGNAEKAQLWQRMREGEVSDDEVKGSVSKTPIEEVVAARGQEFLETVPAGGESIQVVDKANVSLGGQTEDVTEQVNPALAQSLSEFLQTIGLPLCGIDVLSTDITSDPTTKQSYVIELNAAPGLRLHELPAQGQPRQVCAQVAELLRKHYQGIAKNS